MSLPPITTFNFADFCDFIQIDTTPEVFDAQCETLLPEQQKEAYTIALFKAAHIGNAVLIEHIIIKKQHDVNSKTLGENTALGAAIFGHHYEIVKQLIGFGADPHEICASPDVEGELSSLPAELAIKMALPALSNMPGEETTDLNLLQDTSKAKLLEDIDLRIIKLIISKNGKYRLDTLLLHQQQFGAIIEKQFQADCDFIKLKTETICCVLEEIMPKVLQPLIRDYAIDSDEEEIAYEFVKKQMK